MIETASLNTEELSEYCRRKGLYPEQIERWKKGAIRGTETSAGKTKAEKRELEQERKKSCQLAKELRRKEKALPEAAALLVLPKKAQVIWGGRRGRMIESSDRLEIINLVSEAVVAGASRSKSCEVLDISVRTL